LAQQFFGTVKAVPRFILGDRITPMRVPLALERKLMTDVSVKTDGDEANHTFPREGLVQFSCVVSSETALNL
jgi:hypothetical protein